MPETSTIVVAPQTLANIFNSANLRTRKKFNGCETIYEGRTADGISVKLSHHTTFITDRIYVEIKKPYSFTLNCYSQMSYQLYGGSEAVNRQINLETRRFDINTVNAYLSPEPARAFLFPTKGQAKAEEDLVVLILKNT